MRLSESLSNVFSTCVLRGAIYVYLEDELLIMKSLKILIMTIISIENMVNHELNEIINCFIRLVHTIHICSFCSYLVNESLYGKRSIEFNFAYQYILISEYTLYNNSSASCIVMSFDKSLKLKDVCISNNMLHVW